jgi:site-specific DNA recombinase
MDIYFQMAPLDIKRKMLGSIFPGKLIFQDGKYRTEGMNPALALILQKTSELQKKTGNIVVSENVSGDVPRRGLEPPHLTAPEPKSGVSTNFTTWAGRKVRHYSSFRIKGQTS